MIQILFWKLVDPHRAQSGQKVGREKRYRKDCKVLNESILHCFPVLHIHIMHS